MTRLPVLRLAQLPLTLLSTPVLFPVWQAPVVPRSAMNVVPTLARLRVATALLVSPVPVVASVGVRLMDLRSVAMCELTPRPTARPDSLCSVPDVVAGIVEPRLMNENELRYVRLVLSPSC